MSNVLVMEVRITIKEETRIKLAQGLASFPISGFEFTESIRKACEDRLNEGLEPGDSVRVLTEIDSEVRFVAWLEGRES